MVRRRQRGDLGELVTRITAERAAGRREHQLRDLLVGAGPQTLRHRRMLRIHRHQLARIRGVQHQLAAGDQRLLVRQSQPRRTLQGRQRGVQPQRTHQGVEDDVVRAQLRPLHQTASRVGAADDMAVHLGVDDVRGARAGDGDLVAGQAEPANLLQQHIRLRPVGRDADQLEDVRIVLDDLQGLGPDRPRTPKNYYAFLHPTHCSTTGR